ncbi:hypothetical protein AAG747_24095 [Rapidithrix thailandica]|uniref:Uncharacterized protein n=1 Tax=Rapidithrix thailandica TaxID=413964 RepID=A0AAW9S1G7_9BACT
MRKQLHDIQLIDQYLLKEMQEDDQLLFQAKMLTSAELKENVRIQQKTYQVIRWLSRQQKKSQLESLHQSLMQEEKFAKEVNAIFK